MIANQAPGSPHVTLVEEGGGAPRPESPLRALSSASVTLTLAILGSSVLPVPYAVSRLGVLPGLTMMLVVALSNALAGTLLLRCAGSLDKHSYDSLAEEVGGPSWKLATEVCLVLLLWGNLTGDFCLLADMGGIATGALYPGDAPGWLVAGEGRVIMAALALLVVFPLSCLRHMRELEKAGMAGAVFVAALAAVFVFYASAEGFPAIRSGELPLFRPAVAASLPEAVAVLSFAFYLTPMLLPLLREMPAGRLGVDLTCRAVQVVTVGMAYATYAVIGLFAAARYGLHTEGDVLVNRWLPGRWDGMLDALMTVYLSICMAPIAVTLRCQLENLLIEEGAAMPRSRRVALTAASLLSSLLLALAFPTQAEKMFAVTGATAVCAVCYVMPVAIHLRLYLRGSGWWCYGGRRSTKSWRGNRRMSSHHSFSFDRRFPGTPAGLGVLCGGSGGSEAPDARWLLAADHHAGSAALPRLQPGGTSSQRQLAGVVDAFASQVEDAQRQQQEVPGWPPQCSRPLQAGEWVEEEEEQQQRLPMPRMGGHRWTDLSLNRWLRGQSYDSMGAYPESLPATPMSPSTSSRHGRGGGQDSVDSWSCCDACGGSADRLTAAVGEVWELPYDGEQAQQAQQMLSWSPDGGGLLSCSSLMSLLPVVPEATSVADTNRGGGGRPGDGIRGGVYPCLADAGTGRAAVLPLLWHLVAPLAVMVLGVASSISALCLAVVALL